MHMDLLYSMYLQATIKDTHTHTQHRLQAHVYFRTLFVLVLSIIVVIQLNWQKQLKDTTKQSFIFCLTEKWLCLAQ